MSRRVAAGAPTSPALRRVAIVEDHELLAHSLALALEHEGVDSAVIPARSEDAVLDLLREHRPDIVLLDLELEGEIGSALPLIPTIRDLGAEVIVMTGVTDRVRLAECVEAGAIGLASKTTGFEDLLRCVVAVAEGEGVLGAGERSLLLDELHAHRNRQEARLEPFRRLTIREGEVLQDLMQGLNAEQIAEATFLSVATVRSHIKSILHKLDVRSQIAAVALAARTGWNPEIPRPSR